MVVAVLRAITWATLAAAVTSAVLVTTSSGGPPRIASMTGDLTRGRLPPSSAAQGATSPSARRGMPADPGPTATR